MFITAFNTIASVTDPATKFGFNPADHASKEAAQKLAEAHAATRIVQFTKWLGRAPTEAEIMRGRIDHSDPRTMVEKMKDETFAVVTKPKRPAKYAGLIRDLGGDEDDAMAAAYKETDPRTRQIAIVKAMQRRDADAHDDKVEREAAAAAHGESVAATVAEVSALKERLNWTVGATVSDVLQCDKALAQLRDPEGCPEAAASMVAAVRSSDQQRHAAAMQAANERLAAATAEAQRIAENAA